MHNSVCLFACREPDIPAWAPLLYQLQLLDVRDKPDPLTLPIADRIRIGNQKRERGNFHFQREEYCLAARAYSMALDVLTTRGRGTASARPDNIYCCLGMCCNRWRKPKQSKWKHKDMLEKAQHLIKTFPDQNDVRVSPPVCLHTNHIITMQIILLLRGPQAPRLLNSFLHNQS